MTPNALAVYGKRLALQRASVTETMADAAEAVRELVPAQVSEKRAALLLGVDRNTVRKWLGK